MNRMSTPTILLSELLIRLKLIFDTPVASDNCEHGIPFRLSSSRLYFDYRHYNPRSIQFSTLQLGSFQPQLNSFRYRSNSKNAPTIWNIIRPDGVDVSRSDW